MSSGNGASTAGSPLAKVGAGLTAFGQAGQPPQQQQQPQDGLPYPPAQPGQQQTALQQILKHLGAGLENF